ncbi:MAG: C13 family peptidase [Pseudomonadota bacterium]
MRPLLILTLLAVLLAVPAQPQAARDDAAVRAGQSSDANQPPPHTKPFPNLAIGKTREEQRESFALGPQIQRGLSAGELLEQNRRLDAAFAALQPQRPGTTDAYILTIALDSDPVFAREAREARRVLSARYDGAGRTLTLAGPDGMRNDLPYGSIDTLILSLARIAEVMDPEEDVLVMYTTSHGINLGLAYHYGDTGYGILSPARLKSVLEELGIKRRILLLSACYSGVFIPELASADTAILTAAAGNRTSFGCKPDNDWTYFGDALINRALRQPQPLSEAAQAAALTVAEWETKQRLLASLPQTVIGDGVAEWLPELEARMPKVASERVGRPAVPD